MRTALCINCMAQVRITDKSSPLTLSTSEISKPDQVCNEFLPHSVQVACAVLPLSLREVSNASKRHAHSSNKVANKEFAMYGVRRTYLGFAVINTSTGLAQSQHVTLAVAQQTARDLNWHQKQLERVRNINKQAVKLSLVK